jgi:hypothetical protein
MVRPKWIIIAALIIGLGIFGAYHFLQSDKRKVKKQFQRLSEWVSKEPGEDRLKWMLKVQKIRRLFADSCTVTDESRSLSRTYSPDEIHAHAVSALSQCSKFTLSFHDFDITLVREGKAEALLTAMVKGKWRSGEDLQDVYEVACALRKVEKEWLFKDIKVIEVLKR